MSKPCAAPLFPSGWFRLLFHQRRPAGLVVLADLFVILQRVGVLAVMLIGQVLLLQVTIIFATLAAVHWGLDMVSAFLGHKVYASFPRGAEERCLPFIKGYFPGGKDRQTTGQRLPG